MADADFVIQDKKLVNYTGKEKEVVVPDGIEVIGGSAFRSNKTIERVVLPEGVREIGTQAFAFCKKLRHITLPDSLEKIDNDAFWFCSGVKPESFPDRLLELGNACSLGSRNPALEDAYRRAGMKYTDMYSACIITVTNLRKHRNADRLMCTEISGNNIIVDDTCRIGQRMVYFPFGGVLDKEFASENHLLHKWDKYADPDDRNQYPRNRNILPLDLRGEISEGLALPIEVLSSYTDIRALKDGDRFSTLNGHRICYPYVPKGMYIDFKKRRLISLSSDSFRQKTVVIPWGVETVGEYAFCRCKAETLYIPDSVTKIEHHAFEECEDLRCVRMPDSVRVIENFAFNGCRRLHNVRPPRKISDVGRLLDDPVFEGPPDDYSHPVFTILDGVVFSKDMEDLIRYPLLKSDTEYTVPGGVKRIKERAFFGNKHLTEVIIPDGVTHIEHRAFENCKRLKRVTIPPSVIDMGGFVFIGIYNYPTEMQDLPKGDIGKASIRSIVSSLERHGISEGVLIRGKPGSTAEQYAKKNGCWFEAIR